MATKPKQPTFKNPFELIEEQEEPMSSPTAPVSRFEPPARTVHAPLPFNPYDMTPTQTKSSTVPAQPPGPPSGPKNQKPPTGSFSSPFGQQQEAPVTSNSSSVDDSGPKEEKVYELDENGDIPLLDDIGIEPQKVKERIMVVLKLGTPSAQIMMDPDIGGPAAIAGSFCILLLLGGKLYFGEVYGTFITGTILLYMLLNFMSQQDHLPLFSIMSTLGYCLLPMLTLGLIAVFFSLKTPFGVVTALLAASWASIAAGNFIQVLIRNSANRKALLVYPLFLFYVSFVLIVIF